MIRRSPPKLRFWPLLLLALSGSAAVASTEATDANAVPSQSLYASPFDGYRRYADQPVESWIEANDRVRRIGGWKAYAREAPGSGDADGSGATKARDDGHAAHHD